MRTNALWMALALLLFPLLLVLAIVSVIAQLIRPEAWHCGCARRCKR